MTQAFEALFQALNLSV